ncbi:MAG: four-carbon acid sugar kinase family protein, partial [Pseudoflavonifractor sp.]
MEKQISAEEIQRYPLPDLSRVEALLAAEVEQSRHKIIVLDDDPTGIQTIHDVSVYTDWTRESLRQGFQAPGRLFFLLTNSRSLTAEETTAVHIEIGENVAAVAHELGMEYLIMNRGDSTLRGHYPLETELLRMVAERASGQGMDGEILCPFFKEGGRFTIDNIHYVKYDHVLVPCGQTEFAGDETFGYQSSDLRAYVEEKTAHACRAENVTCISLARLRALDYEGVEAQLESVRNYGRIVVNAVDDCDVRVLATALYRTLAKGHRYTICCAAALVKAMGNITDRPCLTRPELVTGSVGTGGIIVVGSHTKKTTAQLEELKKCSRIEFIEMNSDLVLQSGGLEAETAAIVARCDALLAAGRVCCVSTKRALLSVENDRPEDALMRSVKISDALQQCVGRLSVAPAFVVAKGGITSSDVGVKALGCRCARVLGQIRPGIPVWRTGPESRFPGVPYVIFPGNVGE